ncbi:MAG: hypothetical protein AB7U07_20160, partial [Thermoleophilia bacterium]
GVGDARRQQRLDHGRAGVTARYRRRLEPAAAFHPDGEAAHIMAPWPARPRRDGDEKVST